MEENHKIDFAKKKGATDEWYTPESAVMSILKHIPIGKIIWCPFDTKESNFVKILTDCGHIVEFSHIENKDEDFFNYEPFEWDIIISNPPYSIRNDILKRVFSFKKPFALLMNTNGLFDSKVRWDMFSENDFSLFYLKGRVNYMKTYGEVEKSSPPFQSAYITSGLFREKIVFENNKLIDKYFEFDNTIKAGCCFFPEVEYKIKGVPVWHIHESFERLKRLMNLFPYIAIGSSGEYSKLGTPKWHNRMNEVMKVLCCEDGYPKVKIHMLRCLDPKIFTKYPFHSGDSTNIARNHNRKGWKPIMEKIEASDSPKYYKFEKQIQRQINFN